MDKEEEEGLITLLCVLGTMAIFGLIVYVLTKVL